MAKCRYSADSARDPHPLLQTFGPRQHAALPAPGTRPDADWPNPWPPTACEAQSGAVAVTNVITNRS